MKLIELTVIYLAAGSPFVAHQVMSVRGRANRLATLARSTLAFVLWPFTIISFLVKKGKAIRDHRRRGANYVSKIEEAGERLTDALNEMCESVESGRNSDELARSVIAARDRIEKYICLTLSARETRFGSQPYKHETELFRVAGRKGEDAATAVRCLHRRNHARLIEHQARARTELLHTLAELREITARDREGHPSKSDETFQRNLSVIFLKLYGQALNLFSLTEDEKATGGASRLLEAECARLRRMEREVSGSESSEVDESCKPHAHHLAFTGLSQTRT